MPVRCQFPVRALNREEFGRISFDVMRDLFAVHNEMGRFFEEDVYQQALARMRSDVRLGFWIDATHADFRKRYVADVLVGGGGLLAFKAVDALAPRHQGELLNCLMLADLRHGMLVNVRPERIEREFVNNAMTYAERLRFDVENVEFDAAVPGAQPFRDRLLAMLRDWGTGLELSLYEEALTHFFGGKGAVEQPVDVFWESQTIGTQQFRLAASNTALKVTALEDVEAQRRFEEHARRLVKHTALDGLLWANVARHCVTFTTIKAERSG